jgi:hypothetical protein
MTTTTIIDTVKAPQNVQRKQTILPTVVFGEKSPNPTEDIVIITNHMELEND